MRVNRKRGRKKGGGGQKCVCVGGGLGGGEHETPVRDESSQLTPTTCVWAWVYVWVGKYIHVSVCLFFPWVLKFQIPV